MKFELTADLADSLFVQFLREEADTVWHALRYERKQEILKDYELRDLWYNYQLLGAMYLVEEYLTDHPEIRTKYPREFTPEQETELHMEIDEEKEIENWMAWDE